MENQEKIYRSFEEAVCDRYGEKVSVVRTVRMPGGDINQAYRLTLSNGNSIFIKANKTENLRFFEAENEGLIPFGRQGRCRFRKQSALDWINREMYLFLL